MSNVYWPIFRRLESEIEDLAFAIHIDDTQLNVYSPRIVDLILRAASDIESISKELYVKNGGPKKSNPKFDHVCLKYLIKIWQIDKKIIYLSSPHCFQLEKILQPFVCNEKDKEGKDKFGWNNAYQNLKHHRAAEFRNFGTIKYLFDIMAALFLLNVYYKNETFELGKDSMGLGFQRNLGSSLFSVEIAKIASSKFHENHIEHTYFTAIEQATYYINETEQSEKNTLSVNKKQNEIFKNLVIQNEKIIFCILSKQEKTPLDLKTVRKIIGHDEYNRILQISFRESNMGNAIKKEEHQAILNKRPGPQ
jgi:hypothetical protein